MECSFFMPVGAEVQAKVLMPDFVRQGAKGAGGPRSLALLHSMATGHIVCLGLLTFVDFSCILGILCANM